MRVRREVVNTIGWLAITLWLGTLVWACVTIARDVDRLERVLDARQAVTVTLPPCDDDHPGAPVTGPCWLADNGTVAVWPYPYAPHPLYVLTGSTP